MIAYGAYEATGEDAKPVFEHNIVEVVTFQELDLTSAETGVRLLTCLGLVGSLIGGHNLAQRRYAFWRADQAAKRPPGWHEEIPDPEA